MSGILGVFGRRPSSARACDAMIAELDARGRARVLVESVDGGRIVLRQHEWEAPGGTVVDGPITVAADATLYYRNDLLKALAAAGCSPVSDGPAALIAAAYRAWGLDCASRLEGDFAFVLWDSVDRRLLAARDFCGKRPLYFGGSPDDVIAASEPGSVLRHPHLNNGWNLHAIAEDAAGMTGSAYETAFTGVQRVPPGARVVWSAGAPPRMERYWDPPPFRDHGGGRDKADELRVLIKDAVRERLDPAAPTVVWLSGGWDSPAVFAAARDVTARMGGPVLPLSVSYPPGDPGREDELIASICGHWDVPPRFLDSRRVPVLERAAARSAARTEPLAHPFENMNRALARASHELGARVVLDGGGGDQLFQVSSVHLADLFSSGRWLALAREWRTRSMGYRRFFKLAIQPTLPPPLLRLATVLRGGKPLTEFTPFRQPPAWIRSDFVRRYALMDRERAHAAAPATLSRAARESHLYFTLPIFGRMAQFLGSFALDEGLEHRSPLFDERLVRFAASRPVAERRRGGETKRLLRDSMRGLLPDSVLESRPYRTGETIGYLARGLRAGMGPLLDECLQNPVLGDLGIIEPSIVRSAWNEFLRTDDRHTAVALYLTVETELWLRTHASAPLAGAVAADAAESLSLSAAT